jgi:hypothetical protein
MYESALSGTGIPVKIEIADYEAAISFWHRPLHVDAAGRLWALAGEGMRDQPEGVLLSYDVFDPAGHFVEQVAIACEGDPRNDALFWISEDSVVLVTGYMGALAAQFGRAAAVDVDEEVPQPQEVVFFRVQS